MANCSPPCFSEDYLRAQLMRSTSDEAINSKSEDLEDDVDSIRSPFYKPRPPPLRYPLLSPQSPPSDSSSYQGSIPGSAPSDRQGESTFSLWYLSLNPRLVSGLTTARPGAAAATSTRPA